MSPLIRAPPPPPPTPPSFMLLACCRNWDQSSCRMSHILDISVFWWCRYLVPVSPEFPKLGTSCRGLLRFQLSLFSCIVLGPSHCFPPGKAPLIYLNTHFFFLVSIEFGLGTVLGTLGTTQMNRVIPPTLNFFLEADCDQQRDRG